MAYDSIRNITRIAETNRERFDTIVVSTWDSEELPNRTHLESLGVVVCQGPSQSVAGLPNHLKQVAGVLAGVQAIGPLDPADRITKTRTDTWFDLGALVDHVERADQTYPSWREVGQLGFIHCGNSRGPFYLEDMFVSARAQDFTRFWEASAHDRRGFAGGGIHESLPLEYAWSNRQHLHISKDMFWDFYRWVAPWHTSVKRLLVANGLWRHLMLHSFCLAPEMAETEFIWRGGPSSHFTNRRRMKRYQFFEQWELLREDEGALGMLTDLEYFERRRPTGVRDFLGRARRAMRVGRVLLSSK